MKKNNLIFTAGEFAKLHDINKRTLHYYDDIGLFSPLHKGENGYRYYTPYQSATFENILALRELGMSIKEIKEYLDKPNNKDFLNLSATRIEEIECTIKKLTTLKKILKKKSEMLTICDDVYDGLIRTTHCPEAYLFMSDTTFNAESFDTAKHSMDKILEHLKISWSMSSFKLGCGSFIAIEKIISGDFINYDGLFTEMESYKKNLYKKQKGRYLQGFCIGDWSKIPALYGDMLLYAKQNNLLLQGFAFERGQNEFAISDAVEYVTEISIFCGEIE